MLQIHEKENVLCAQLDLVIGGRKSNTVFVFLVDGMLIDTGSKSLEEHILPFYAEHSFDLVTLTHSHEDHSGTAPWIEQHRGVPIYIHENGIDICAEPYPYPQYRQLIWGKREAFTALPLGETIESNNDTWEVIYTPGHADDHISLYNRETGQLFSGDLYVHPDTKLVTNKESIPEIMRSIKTLLTYDFGALYCCHAGYVEQGKKALQEKLENLEQVIGEVRHLHHQGLSIEEIQEKLYPKKYPLTTISDGEWDSKHIVSSIVAEIK